MTTAPDRLFEEVAYLAFHFHWSHAEIVDLEHPLRRRYVDEAGRIAERVREGRP
ncbi:MAG TPA: DUF6760 family protein [Frankiaceae bacterium]|nr:DUF6760 family protein [Frankiaceae bacterium]